MSTIYIAERGGQPTGYSEEQAEALWAQGSISREAYYWKEGMSDWRPATEFFRAGATAVSIPPALGSADSPRSFAKDPRRLTQFLKVMLWISFGLAALAAIIGAISLANGNAAMSNEGNLSITAVLEGLIGLLQLIVIITTVVPFLMWIHRANRNARHFGAEGLTFTPGWSVGWYFVPILNLWKPYQAMKEIWQASRNPRSWSTQEVSPLVSRWWTLWLVSGFLGQMSFRLALHSGSESSIVSSGLVSLLSDFVDIFLCFVAIRLVTSIYQMQCQWAQQPA